MAPKVHVWSADQLFAFEWEKAVKAMKAMKAQKTMKAMMAMKFMKATMAAMKAKKAKKAMKPMKVTTKPWPYYWRLLAVLAAEAAERQSSRSP